MIFVEPKVHLLARTQLRGAIPAEFDGEMVGNDTLSALQPGWKTDAATGGEKLIEYMGRMCYNSFEVGVNPNVVAIREGNHAYIQNVVSQKHGSIFEHVTLTFLFENVSRVFTHELVRHRVGVAFSQESLRYVRIFPLKMWLPELAAKYGLDGLMVACLNLVDGFLEKLNKVAFSDGYSFKVKKKLTSLIRRVAPQGMATNIGFTANLRTLRHLIELRTHEGAEEEIRMVFGEVAEICIREYPAVFADFEKEMVDGFYKYTTPNSKI